MWDIFKRKALQWHFTEWRDCKVSVSVTTAAHFWDSREGECTEMTRQRDLTEEENTLRWEDADSERKALWWWEEEETITASFWDDETVIFFNLEVENSVNSSSSDITNLSLITADTLWVRCWWGKEDATLFSELIAESELPREDEKWDRDKDRESSWIADRSV